MEITLFNFPTEEDLKPTAVCPACQKEWTMPKEWELRCRVARHWKLQGKVFSHICPNCEKQKKAEKA